MDGHYDPMGADEPGDVSNYFDPSHGRKEWQKRMESKAAVAKPKPAVALSESHIQEEAERREKSQMIGPSRYRPTMPE
jgi:hypothetical protein